MPISAPSPCATPGCAELVASGHCEQHRRQRQTGYDERRGNRHARGYDAEWYRWLAAFRRGDDLAIETVDGAAALLSRNRCAACWRDGQRTIHGLEYDHIVPLGCGGPRLDVDNVQPLCAQHHRAKTAGERAMG